MRAIVLGFVVFALGLATAALVASPRAGAHATDGTLSATVSPNFTIGMSASSVAEGNYTIDVSDNSSIHNFHLSGPGVNKSTTISGTGSTSWSVALQPGTYSFQCDAHAATMNGSLTVTATATTTTDTTTTTQATTTPTTTTAPTTTAHTTTERHTTTQATTSAETTAATTTTAETTTATASTTEATTTAATPTTPSPLKAHVTKTHATSKTVSVTITSNERGRAVAELFAGTRRVARATGTVPGTLVLHAAHPLNAGSYVLKLRVTAGTKTTTTSRVVRIA